MRRQFLAFFSDEETEKMYSHPTMPNKAFSSSHRSYAVPSGRGFKFLWVHSFSHGSPNSGTNGTWARRILSLPHRSSWHFRRKLVPAQQPNTHVCVATIRFLAKFSVRLWPSPCDETRQDVENVHNIFSFYMPCLR